MPLCYRKATFGLDCDILHQDRFEETPSKDLCDEQKKDWPLFLGSSEIPDIPSIRRDLKTGEISIMGSPCLDNPPPLSDLPITHIASSELQGKGSGICFGLYSIGREVLG